MTLRRVSRQSVEALVQAQDPERRVSRIAVEGLVQATNPLRRVSRLVIEALISDLGPHVFFDITDLPADFGNAETAEIEVRYRGQNFGTGTVTLFARLFQSDEGTPLSDEVQVAQVTADTAFANATVAFTGLNTTADKAVWDAARIRFRWASS